MPRYRVEIMTCSKLGNWQRGKTWSTHHIQTWYLNHDWRAGAAVSEVRRYITTDEEGEDDVPA